MAGFLSAQRCRHAVCQCGRAVLDVIEQETGVRQQVCVDTKQLTGLPRTLPTAMQQRLDLVVQTEDIRKDTPRRQARMRLGKSSPYLVDLADRLVGGVASSNPRYEPSGIVLRPEHLTCGVRL